MTKERAPRNKQVEKMMLRDPHSVKLDAHLGELGHFLEKHHFCGGQGVLTASASPSPLAVCHPHRRSP